MPKRVIVRKNEYHDSVLLMTVSEQVRKMPGVSQAMVSMATENNLQIIRDLGLMTPEGENATVNDMVVAIDADSDAAIDKAVANMDDLFVQRAAKSAGQVTHRTFDAALRAMPDANLCVISTPGDYARDEGMKALKAGLHVLLFSDNVPMEHERELKEYAAAKGLLCMGPDCGVANINGIALATGSAVRKGPIGVVGASGSGTQEITVLAEREGLGISQAIGTGGKDLKDDIGGLTMLVGIDALEEDPETRVIVLVSRTPGAKTLPKILDRVKQCKKPVVVYFIGGDPKVIEAAGAHSARDLEDASYKAVDLAYGRPFRTGLFSQPESEINNLIKSETAKMTAGQKWLRGLFCGGTFCEEAMAVSKDIIGDIWSNAPLRPDLRLKNSRNSVDNTIVDFGDEEFTVGRPHPVIDPEPRRRHILVEGKKADVAVLLLDFILSYAVHPDPVGAVTEAIKEVKADAEKNGRYLSVIASVCGSEGDPQRLSAQEQKLRQVGAIVMASNAQAARLAAMITKAAGAK